MPSLRVLPLLALLSASASLTRCGMCEPNRGPEPGASASASASAPAASGSAAPRSSASATGPQRPKPRLNCRVIEGIGDARMETGPDAGAPVLIQGILPSYWVDMPAGSKLVAKDPQTTRETTFRGAGRIKACVMAQEESWLASGGFESSVGTGESPGAEEWVVTPLGVVFATSCGEARDRRASVDVSAGARDVHVAVASGEAFLWTSADATLKGAKPADKTDDGWVRADPGTFVITGTGPSGTRPLTEDGARTAVSACGTLGKSAHDLSAQLLAGGADAGTVLAQVTTRRLARAACAVGSLRLGALPPTATTASLGVQLNEGTAGWSTLPDAPAAPP